MSKKKKNIPQNPSLGTQGKIAKQILFLVSFNILTLNSVLLLFTLCIVKFRVYIKSITHIKRTLKERHPQSPALYYHLGVQIRYIRRK